MSWNNFQNRPRQRPRQGSSILSKENVMFILDEILKSFGKPCHHMNCNSSLSGRICANDCGCSHFPQKCNDSNIWPDLTILCHFCLWFFPWFLWHITTDRDRWWLKTCPAICICTSYHSSQLLEQPSDKNWIQVCFGDFALYYRYDKSSAFPLKSHSQKPLLASVGTSQKTCFYLLDSSPIVHLLKSRLHQKQCLSWTPNPKKPRFAYVLPSKSLDLSKLRYP